MFSWRSGVCRPCTRPGIPVPSWELMPLSEPPTHLVSTQHQALVVVMSVWSVSGPEASDVGFGPLPAGKGKATQQGAITESALQRCGASVSPGSCKAQTGLQRSPFRVAQPRRSLLFQSKSIVRS